MLSIAFDGRTPLPDLVEQARAADAAGADAFWVASHLFMREPFTMATAVLGASTRARGVLMALSPHVLHPVQIAMGAATLDELFPGRVSLCIGTGAPGDIAGAAITPQRPLRALRETVEIARALLTGERVRYQGEMFRVEDRALHSGRHPMPIYLAASGPQSLELAGAIADGVVLSASASVEFVRWSLDHVDRGARGRSVQRAALVYVAAGTGRAARDRFRRNLAINFRGAHHARNLQLAGLTLDQESVRQAVAAGDWTKAEALIGDDIVHKHTATGTPEEVLARLAEYRAAGLDEIVLAGLTAPTESVETLRAVGGTMSGRT